MRDTRSSNQGRLDELSSILQSVAAMYSKVFIAIDALDECRVSQTLLLEMSSLQTESGTNILLSSIFRRNQECFHQILGILNRYGLKLMNMT